MSTFVAVVRPAVTNARDLARLRPAARKLHAELRRVSAAGVKVTVQHHAAALLLVASGPRPFSDADRTAAVTAIQSACDSLWTPGTFLVAGHTQDSMPAA